MAIVAGPLPHVGSHAVRANGLIVFMVVGIQICEDPFNPGNVAFGGSCVGSDNH